MRCDNKYFFLVVHYHASISKTGPKEDNTFNQNVDQHLPQNSEKIRVTPATYGNLKKCHDVKLVLRTKQNILKSLFTQL
jgi:hypothetical protein